MIYTDKHTKIACYLGYVSQAIVNVLPPLLFVTFQEQFGVTLSQLAVLIALNFAIQILVDLFGARYVDRIGYRKCTVFAHFINVIGLACLGMLPFSIGFWGVLTGMLLNAIGGGLMEVLVSPIMESIPGDAKSGDMSLLHSFYCWGSVAVVLGSTAFFVAFGRNNWYILPLIWASVPLFNMFFFFKVPLHVLVAPEERTPVKTLFKTKMFWLFLMMMLGAGASEMAISQWSSLFAEEGLGVNKTVGDLMGPCAFAVFMGLMRVYYGKKSRELNLHRALLFSGVLCIGGYLLCVFGPHPMVSLIGCSVCGFAVGLMWPGVFSLCAQRFSTGGTAMFALMALAGDLGCTFGPGLVGMVSDLIPEDAQVPLVSGTSTMAGLKIGILSAIIFPILLVLSLILLRKKKETD